MASYTNAYDHIRNQPLKLTGNDPVGFEFQFLKYCKYLLAHNKWSL